MTQRPGPREAQARILHLLLTFPSNAFATHTEIAERLGLDADYVRDNVDALKRQGRVRVMPTLGALHVAITGQARLELEEAAHTIAAQAAADRETLKAALKLARRAESVLAKQAGQFGSGLVPVHLVLELEDKQAEIAQLEQQLSKYDQADERGVA